MDHRIFLNTFMNEPFSCGGKIDPLFFNSIVNKQIVINQKLQSKVNWDLKFRMFFFKKRHSETMDILWVEKSPI
jgi:hypothetical protein